MAPAAGEGGVAPNGLERSIVVRGRDALFQQRRLLRELRRLRQEADHTQRSAAEALDWSSSKLVRIEAGTVGLAITDLQALLRLYRVSDEAQVDDLVTALRDSRNPPWWKQYGDILAPVFQTLLGFESAASVIREFHPLMVPGLLQTEEYIKALFRGFDVDLDADDRLLKARLERQRLLDYDDRPELLFVMYEAAIRNNVGGPAVMADQLRHLKDLSQRPGVTIQLIDLDVGSYGGLTGPFILLELADDQVGENGDHLMVFVETLGRDYLIQDDPGQSRPYLQLFDKLAKQVARPKEDTVAILDQALEQLM
jgi:transcriptional regulator with XRE-family HTH domain